MFVVHNCTLTPSGNFDQVLVPGVYTADQFASVTNITRNTVLYVSTDEHAGSIVVTNDGVQTTLNIYPSVVGSEASDELQVICYSDAPGVSPGPATNVAVTNFPASQNINGSVSINGEVEVKNDTGNPLPVTGTVTVGNFPATQPISGSVSVNNLPATQPISGSVSVSNFPATQAVTGTFWPPTQPISGSVSVSNFPATQPISGTVTANQGTSPWVTSVNNFPATQSVIQGTSPWVVSGTVNVGSNQISSFPATSTDAFGRLRISEPFTMFDSSHRFDDNDLWATSSANGGGAVFNNAQGLVDLGVTTAAGSQVIRETLKVFSYQPGKSLQVMSTFVMNPAKVGLTQRVGYYGSGNGYYLELNDTANTLCFVERSSVSGALVNTKISQLGGVYGPGDTGWNVDPMDGSGPSGITLDITKAQILWMDLEWLGVGTVRMGFVINGQFYICHEWQHANIITSTYITTASLPLRYEIINNASTASASTLKQICSTVISEGGYVLAGQQQSVGTSITAPKVLAVAGTYYPLVSLRLKTTRLDAIVILTAISILGSGNNETFQWQVRASGTTTAGSWVSAGSASAVEYNLTGTAYTGGRILASGFTSSSNQGSPSVDILKQALFSFQLERNIFTATPYELTIVLAGANNSVSAYASMDWEEISR
jgi:hypothetical protein